MKRVIKAWSTSEPSASEYGDFMDSYRKNLREKYAPFVVTQTHLSNNLASDGYRITLDVEAPEDDFGGIWQEWILKEKYDGHYDLYGPFEPGDIRDVYALYRNKPIGQFKDINSAMTWLFKNVDYPDED